MILWLPGWPHSGNSLVRTLLRDVFGLDSFSMYPGTDKPTEHGAEFYGDDGRYIVGTWPKTYVQAVQEPGWIPIKTHEHPILLSPWGLEAPETTAPAIWVARDGRQALVSLAAYWQRKIPIAQIILGHHRFGCWTDFYRAWKPHERDNTIVVRFEDVLADPNSAIERISVLLDRKPTGKFVNRFAEQHKGEPRLFRQGSIDEWKQVLTPAQLRLFWKRHWQTMTALGYQAS